MHAAGQLPDGIRGEYVRMHAVASCVRLLSESIALRAPTQTGEAPQSEA